MFFVCFFVFSLRFLSRAHILNMCVAQGANGRNPTKFSDAQRVASDGSGDLNLTAPVFCPFLSNGDIGDD